MLLGLAQVVGVSLAMGAVGLFAPVPVLLVHLAVAGIVLVRFPIRDEGRGEAGLGPPSPGGAAAVAVGVTLAVAAMVPAFLGRATTQVETRHYHVANLASWVDRGSIWPLPFQNPGFATATHPGNGELLGAWASLPTHGDEVAYLGNVAFGLLAVLAVALLVRQLGGRPGLGAVAALAVIAAPNIFMKQAYSLTTDFPAAAGIMAAVALIHRAGADGARRVGAGTPGEPEGLRPWMGLAGIALGLGVGSKYTALAPAILVVAYAAVRLRPRSALGWLLPGLAVLALPWFLRNAIATGNPIFPQGVEALGLPGYRSPLESVSTPIGLHLVTLNGGALGRWAEALARNWGPGFLLLPAGIAAGLARRRDGHDRLAPALLAAGFFVAYLVLPFTGDEPLMASNTRYALPSLLLAGSVAAAAAPRALVWAVSGSALAFGGWQMVTAPRRAELDLGWWWLAAVAGGAVAGAAWLRSREARAASGAIGRWRPRPALAAMAVMAASGLAASSLVGIAIRRQTPTSLEEAAGTIRLRYGEPFAVVGAFDLRSLLGRRLDLSMRTISAGGATGEEPYRDAAAFEAALDASGLRVLVIAPGNDVSMPPGWLPAPEEWCDVGGSLRERIYVRRSAGESCPPEP